MAAPKPYHHNELISQFASDFAHGYVEEELPGNTSQTDSTQHKSPVYRQFNSMPNEFAYIARCIKLWEAEGESLSGIGLIYPNIWSAASISEMLAQASIPHQLVKTQADLRQISADAILLLPRELSVNLAFSRIIIAGLGRLNSDESHFAEEIQILYRVMNNARTHLVMTASNDNAFTSRVESICWSSMAVANVG